MGDRGWYPLGAMRIAWIMEAGQHMSDISEVDRGRAAANAHVDGDYLEDGQRIFIANRAHSGLWS
ncbi:MAG: hypothetical protein ACHQDD_06080 [Steroidobacterales bacterium]